MALFVVLGSGIGAVLALLLAPQSGERTRRELSKAFNEGTEAGRGATQEAIRNLEKEFADLRKRVEERVH